MERSKASMKEKEIPAAYHYLIKIQYNKHNMVLFLIIRKKYNSIQLTKAKIDLNNRKITNHRPSPGICA